MSNYAIKLLLENAQTYKERGEVTALTENETARVSNVMVSNLYQSAINKSHVDFDDIPESKGDITKYSGYRSLTDTHTLLKSLAEKSNVKIPELDVVETALRNLISYADTFKRGFAMGKEFIILEYNVLTHALVEGTSVIISSYVDFVKRVDKQEFVILKSPDRPGSLALTNLAKFNDTVKNGSFGKLNNQILSGKDNFVGTGTIVGAAAIIGVALTIVPLIRELIFLFYFSRMRLSEYLKQQAALLEINKANIELSSLPASRKKEVLSKQNKTIRQFQEWSDKVKVNKTIAEPKATEALKKENSGYRVSDLVSSSASEDERGFQLL